MNLTEENMENVDQLARGIVSGHEGTDSSGQRQEESHEIRIRGSMLTKRATRRTGTDQLEQLVNPTA